MSDTLRSILVGTVGLSATLAVAVAVTLTRGPVRAGSRALTSAARWAVVATAVQFAHFAEEFGTGFPQRFPELFGLAPWPASFFVSFNLVWILAWALASRGLLARRLSAVAVLWFLGIAGLINGLAHPVLAMRSGGYFPGLLTSPLIGAAGLILMRRLTSITLPSASD